MTHNAYILAAFAIYLAVMMVIGIYHYRRTHDMADYILGNRRLGAWVVSMSAEASDMSGWLLMGLPGFAYVAGLNAMWIALGLALGTIANWKFIAARLRVYTEVAANSLTLPDFLHNRFRDGSNFLRVIPALFTLVFFTIYTSSGFVAGARLFETIFALPYGTALLMGAFVVVFYTFVGGFLAVCRTDFIQGIMMFFAIVMVPMMGVHLMGGALPTVNAISAYSPAFFQPLTKTDGSLMSLVEIVSLLGWGLGYFGQPHILVRFMAIRKAEEIRQAMHIATVWVIVSLSAAVFVGMVGRVCLAHELLGADCETVFLAMSQELFSPFVAGLIFSAVLAAIMSTISSQLLVAASAFAQDFYHTSLRPAASAAELVWVGRLSVLAVALLAGLLAMSPDSLILDIVAYAWAGFGATFGPVILAALFWRRATRRGAIAGVAVGGLTVLIWKQLALWGLYEIVPGFALSLLAIYVVSMMDAPPPDEITREFDRVGRILAAHPDH